MKKLFIRVTLFLFTAVSILACSKEDKLDSKSILPTEDDIYVDNSEVGKYLKKTFEDPYNIKVNYRMDINQFGVGRDALRNLYPPAIENVIPAMDMVNKVWIQSYVNVKGNQFVKDIRPIEFLLAGGPSLNDDGTRVLGLATAGARVNLYELDDVVDNPVKAKEFIHTIQHEYIHIINMKAEFDENDFGSETVSGYTPNWYEHTNEASNQLGFVTNYSRSNIFEDFAETASYLLTHTEAEYQALLSGVNADAARKISNKVEKVRDYFKKAHDLDFVKLCKVANENASKSKLLNRGGASTNSVGTNSTYGVKTTSDGKRYVHSCEFHSVTEQHKHKL